MNIPHNEIRWSIPLAPALLLTALIKLLYSHRSTGWNRPLHQEGKH